MWMATKSMASCAAALGLLVGLSGCAEDNEKAVVTDPNTGKVTKGVTPKDAPTDPQEAYKAMMKNDPMKNSKGYPGR